MLCYVMLCYGLSVGITVTVSVPSNKVRVVIVLTKSIVKIISLVL